MGSPIKAVLNSPELLTSILTQLSPQDLLTRAQRVSHTWHALINTSLKLQQFLFFAPLPANPNVASIPNPLFTALDPNSHHPFEAWYTLLRTRITDTLQYSSDLSFSLSGRSPTQQAALTHRTASWRKMLPMQPPPLVLEVVKMHPSGLLRKAGQPRGEVARVNFEDGVKMGVLYDLGWETASRDYAKWAVLWNMVPFDKETMAPRQEFGDEWEKRETRRTNMRLAQRREQTYPLENKITFLMDLSMPLANMINFMKPQHKSEGYESLEGQMEWRDLGVEELTHLAQMCAGECKLH
ncbi:uncharacterized protein PAC_19354 [Phialocephala subalpina]|uniref:F-box domain-containing protein n=1 Tax=Phialocephala subalpina TaxID=576137 RepID=A0A1L7XWP4_9HELO|nr:uncharacterized protein PAC_19354 [Phialocephala subalpina]